MSAGAQSCESRCPARIGLALLFCLVEIQTLLQSRDIIHTMSRDICIVYQLIISRSQVALVADYLSPSRFISEYALI